MPAKTLLTFAFESLFDNSDQQPSAMRAKRRFFVIVDLKFVLADCSLRMSYWSPSR